MKRIKLLLGISVGLLYAIIVCGISSLFKNDVSFLYNMSFGEYLPSSTYFSVGFILSSIFLVYFVAINFVMEKAKKWLHFLIFALLHILCSFCLFFLKNITFSFLIICIILILYIKLFLGVQRVYPRFFVINLVYFLWICQFLVINYCLLIFN